MKINEPVPEEAMKAQAITLPPLCFRWACMFGIMSRSFFLQTLAFPSLWSIKPCPRIVEARLLFFLLMSGLHLLVYPLYFCSWSLLRTVDCDTFTPALWRLLLMSLTVVLGSFFTAVTMFLSSTADVFLDLPVRGVLLSTPVVSFFLRRFQMVVLAIASICAMVWLIFHLLSASQLLVFHP